MQLAPRQHLSDALAHVALALKATDGLSVWGRLEDARSQVMGAAHALHACGQPEISAGEIAELLERLDLPPFLVAHVMRERSSAMRPGRWPETWAPVLALLREAEQRFPVGRGPGQFAPPARFVGFYRRTLSALWDEIRPERQEWLLQLEVGASVLVVDDYGHVFGTRVRAMQIHQVAGEPMPQLWLEGHVAAYSAARVFPAGWPGLPAAEGSALAPVAAHTSAEGAA